MKLLNNLVLLFFIFFTSYLYCQDATGSEIIKAEKFEVMCWLAKEGEYIINNNNDYQALLANRVSHRNCISYTLPFVDFSKYTLIGYVSIIGGCNAPEIKHEVSRKKSNYTARIEITQKGSCKLGIIINLWYLIPKIGESDNVFFNVTKTVVN